VAADPLRTIPEPDPGLAVGTDPAGNAVAIWRLNRVIRAASRPAGGTYGTPATLAPTSGEGPAELAIGLGAGGRAVALWTVRTAEADPGYARRTVWAADRAPDGTWSAPYVLAGPDARHSTLLCGGCPDDDRQPAVAVDAAGNAVAAWMAHQEPTGTAILWGARPAGGAWSAPTVLSHPAGPDVQMLMTATGTAVATWMEDGWLHSAVRPPGAGAFGPARHLGEVSGYGSGLSRMPPSLTIDGEGRTLAVWTSGNRILAARRRNAGPWGDPTDLSALTKPEPPKPEDPTPTTSDPTPKADLLRNVTLSHARMTAPTCSKRRPHLPGRRHRARLPARGRGRGPRDHPAAGHGPGAPDGADRGRRRDTPRPPAGIAAAAAGPLHGQGPGDRRRLVERCREPDPAGDRPPLARPASPPRGRRAGPTGQSGSAREEAARAIDLGRMDRAGAVARKPPARDPAVGPGEPPEREGFADATTNLGLTRPPDRELDPQPHPIAPRARRRCDEERADTAARGPGDRTGRW
jgi:hypothetical protein